MLPFCEVSSEVNIRCKAYVIWRMQGRWFDFDIGRDTEVLQGSTHEQCKSVWKNK